MKATTATAARLLSRGRLAVVAFASLGTLAAALTVAVTRDDGIPTRVLGDKLVAQGNPNQNNGCGVGNGGSSGTKVCSGDAPGKAFTMTSTSSGGVAPGVSQQLHVTVHNPNNQDLHVTRITPSVASATPATCNKDWVSVAEYSYSNGDPEVIAPANGTAQVSLTISFVNLNSNQDACKGATFNIDLTGDGQQVR